MTNSQLFLTIAVPTFNRADKLLRQLEMLLGDMSGHESELELLVSDNASTDGTQAMLKSRFPVGSRGPIIHRNGSNVGAGRNVLGIIDRAQGRYLWIVGDDDRLHPGIVPAVLAALRRDQPGLLFINHQAIDAGGRAIIPSALPLIRESLNLLDVFKHSGTTVMFISASVYRRDLLKAVVADDRDQQDRLSVPLYWSFACARKGGLGIIQKVMIDNIWGETSWKSSVSLVFNVLVPRELTRCFRLGYPPHQVAVVVVRYRAVLWWRALKARIRSFLSRPGAS
jgi:glycosyltransferase involved in cell wall biosynthesis